MKVHSLMLLILGVLTFINLIFGNVIPTINSDITAGGISYINGSATDIQMDTYSVNYDLLNGSLIMLSVISLIAVGLGIAVLGSGISDTSQKVAVKVIIYIALWTLLSYTSIPLILQIETFGIFFYSAFTFLYIYGVLTNLHSDD